ncbi:hypothetical protein DL770_002347 [Monosporascus sp. CRB-9-2]|nr:hypothetical protein DL770_002347 [Monosporascus sp. CRB-9-2]
MVKLHERKRPAPLYRPPKRRGPNFKHRINGAGLVATEEHPEAAKSLSRALMSGVVTTQQARADGRTARTGAGPDRLAGRRADGDGRREGRPAAALPQPPPRPPGLGRVLERRLRLVSPGVRDRSGGSGYGHSRPRQRRPFRPREPPPPRRGARRGARQGPALTRATPTATGTPSSAPSWRTLTGGCGILRERCPKRYPDAGCAGRGRGGRRRGRSTLDV